MDLFGVPYLSDAALANKTGALAHRQADQVYALDRRGLRIKYEALEGSNTALDSLGSPEDLVCIEVSLPLWLVVELENYGDPSVAIIEALGELKGNEFKPSWLVGLLSKGKFTL